MSVIRPIASLDADGMMEARGVAENWGNLKFIPAASLKPSGQSLESGVPSTEQILKISSISELPGNSGLQPGQGYVWSFVIGQVTFQFHVRYLFSGFVCSFIEVCLRILIIVLRSILIINIQP